MHYCTSIAHCATRLRRCVEGVVITIQPATSASEGAHWEYHTPIQKSRLLVRLHDMNNSRLPPFRSWEPDIAWSFWPAPIPLADEECTSYSSGIYISTLLGQGGFSFKHASSFSFIINSNDLGTYLECLSSARGRQRLQERNVPLPVYQALAIELGGAGELDSLIASIKVNDFLVCAFECWQKSEEYRCRKAGSLRRMIG